MPKMMRAMAVAIVTSVAALGVAACGSSDESTTVALTKRPNNPQNGATPGVPSGSNSTVPTQSAGGAAPASPAPDAKPDAGGGTTAAVAEGKSIFTQSCSSCHTFADAGATGQVGPNLDETKMTLAAIVSQITKGGGGMPSFGGNLQPDQIKAIATYVNTAKS
jgi:mono/diheme cytochrome c family protein